MEVFTNRWSLKESSRGSKVLSAAALKEIRNIRGHMEKGCLSGMYNINIISYIQASLLKQLLYTFGRNVHVSCALASLLSGIKPGRGTNRNESLHKNINAIMTSSR